MIKKFYQKIYSKLNRDKVVVINFFILIFLFGSQYLFKDYDSMIAHVITIVICTIWMPVILKFFVFDKNKAN